MQYFWLKFIHLNQLIFVIHLLIYERVLKLKQF